MVYAKKTLLSFIVFLIGGLAHGIVSYLLVTQHKILNDVSFFFLDFPISSLFLYILLVLNYLVYYLSTFSGEESPSLKLYFLLKNGERKTLREIVREFPKKEIIDMRLDSLKAGKFIKQRKDVYVILPRGEKLAKLFTLYRKFLSWQSSG